MGSIFKTNGKNISIDNGDSIKVFEGSVMEDSTSVINFGTSGKMVINGLFKTSNTTGFSGLLSTSIKSRNNPTISLGANSTIEYSSANQTITNYNYRNLSLTGSGTKSFPASSVKILGNLSIQSGVKANLYAGIKDTAKSLTLGGVYKNSSTWGSTSSSAVHRNNTFFSSTTGTL